MRRWVGSGGCSLVALTALLASLSFSQAARADEKARLVYVRAAGAEDCPDEVKLRLWVVARLGYDPFSPQASNVVIARVESRDQQLQGTVEMIDAQGTSTGRRELASPETVCETLARALALSISLAIDPERASQPPPESSEPVTTTGPFETKPDAPPPSPPPETPPPETPRAPATTPTRRVRSPASAKMRTTATRLLLRAAFVTNVGALPGPAFGGELSAGLRFRRWSLALEGRALQSTARDVEPRGQISGRILGAGLTTCAHFDPVAACLIGQLASQRVESSGVTNADDSSGPYWALGPRVTGEVPVMGSLALELGLEGLVNLAPNHAVLSGRQVWEAPWFAATLLAGLKAHFP
jgi:hypothetical protein